MQDNHRINSQISLPKNKSDFIGFELTRAKDSTSHGGKEA
jgi:hypothetical protein